MLRILFPVSVIMLVLLTACGGDDDADNGGDSPTSTQTGAEIMTTDEASQETDSPTATPPSEATDPASPQEGPGQASARADAERVCPEFNRDICIDSWAARATSSLPLALCVNPDTDRWFTETPGGVSGEPAAGVLIGDACAGGSSFTVVALQNYP